MIRPIEEKDRAKYLSMAHKFYHSDAVLQSVPDSYFEKTFDQILVNSPFVLGYILEKNGKTCGYALLARSWSQEAGGEVIWLEELFVLPEARGKGLGNEFLDFLHASFENTVKRFRLEVEEENTGAIRLYKQKGFEFFSYDQMKKDL